MLPLMKLSMSPPRARSFTIVATDPDVEWRCDVIDVLALSLDDAKRIARARFAEDRRAHWTLSLLTAA